MTPSHLLAGVVGFLAGAFFVLVLALVLQPRVLILEGAEVPLPRPPARVQA